MTGTALSNFLNIVLTMTPIGQDYLMMFALLGALSVPSGLLLIFVFDGKRFEPDWVAIFEKSTEEKMPANLRKSKSSVLVNFHESVTKAKNDYSLRIEKLAAIEKNANSCIE